MKILLLEDDLELGNGVRIALEQNGMHVVWVRQMAEARRQLEQTEFDLVLLDLGLPDGDGIEFLTRLRREGKSTPVLILTARDELTDKLHGLDSGADDYLVKPFALAELLSRLRALARRSYGIVGEVLEIRGLRVQLATMRVSVNDRVVELSPTEFDLLCLLMRRADRVMTRRTLEQQALPSAGDNVSNILDVHISNIRRKIGEGFIRTVRGVGFVLDKEAPRPKVAD